MKNHSTLSMSPIFSILCTPHIASEKCVYDSDHAKFTTEWKMFVSLPKKSLFVFIFNITLLPFFLLLCYLRDIQIGVFLSSSFSWRIFKHILKGLHL